MENLKEIGRGNSVNVLKVDECQVLLSKETDGIADDIVNLFVDEEARFSNMSVFQDMFYKDLAKAMFSVAYWVSDEDFDTVEELAAKEDFDNVKVDPRFIKISDLVVDKINFTYPTRDGEKDIKKHMIDTYKLLRVMERAPYKLPLTLDLFKVLRKFIRNNIKITRPAGDLSNHSIDARSALLQEIRKFNPFYATLGIELGAAKLYSKFRDYDIIILGEENKVKGLIKLVEKTPNFRVTVLQDAEDKKIYIKTRKERLEILIKGYNKKY